MPDDGTLILGSGARDWSEILGLTRTASLHHPDVGGNPEQFRRTNAAYQQGVTERSA